jgi:hypothetical protein
VCVSVVCVCVKCVHRNTPLFVFLTYTALTFRFVNQSYSMPLQVRKTYAKDVPWPVRAILRRSRLKEVHESSLGVSSREEALSVIRGVYKVQSH